MVILAHDFRGHVPRSAAGFVAIIDIIDPLSCNTEIRKFEVALRIEHQVLGLYITVDDLMPMDSFQGMKKASTEKTGLVLGKPALSSQMKSEVSSQEQVHDQIQIFRVLECIMSVNNKPGLDDRQQFELVHDGLDALLVHNSGLEHFLHGKVLDLFSLESVRADPPDLPKASPADRVLVFEQAFVEGCRRVI